jgi:succinate-semialdehyde dehydrogenase/glutarate-semialdehyde dehydrogenase
VNVVTGGVEVGRRLVEHPDVAKIAFTGSTATGQAIAAAAASTLKRLTLELGGSDSMIVLPDADIAAAARGVATGRFFNCGQVCVATKRVFVVGEETHHRFLDLVGRRVAALTVGDGRDDVKVGPLHSSAVLDRFLAQVGDALETGTVVAEARIPPRGPGHFAAPMVVTDVAPTSSVFHEEVFGPLLPVTRVETVEEAIEAANDTMYALGAAVWSGDVHVGRAVAEALRCGYAWINATQRVHRELPFGGLGMSGFGREHGVDAMAGFCESRTFVYPAPSLDVG